MDMLVKWFWDTLSQLGLYQKRARILFLGLDNAGKTTLLHLLRDDKVVIHEPTQHPQQEEVLVGGVRFSAHDLGGHDFARRLWKDYFQGVDGVVFLVDASAPQRFGDARHELTELLATESLQHIPFVVLGNKIDSPKAISEHQLRQALGLESTTSTGKRHSPFERGVRPIEVFMCSVVKRAGYVEAFRWLADFL